jgi:uncharacterized DUF497 family protein
MAFEWDAKKAAANFRKHGVRFPEAEPVLEDDYAITTIDEDSGLHEQRFLSIGMGDRGRVLVVVFSTEKPIFALFRRELPRTASESNTRRIDERSLRFQPR